MLLVLPWCENQMFSVFKNGISGLFAYFWMINLNPFLGKAGQDFKNCLNQKFAWCSISENGFEATLSTEMKNKCSQCLEMTFLASL